jgi:hypothetical protein
MAEVFKSIRKRMRAENKNKSNEEIKDLVALLFDQLDEDEIL